VSSTSSLRAVDLRPRYSSGRDDLIADFFVPCLEAASTYDRAVGFFSSSFFALIDVPIAEFAIRGGKMRLVCSPRLATEDIDAIAAGYEERTTGAALLREIEESLADPTGRAATSLLATLVASDTIEIKVAFRLVENQGLFHDKVGIFTDADRDRISFTGSANETWSAWSGRANHEYFHAFASWKPGDDERVEADSSYFEELWQGREADLSVIDFPEVARARLEEFVDPEGVLAAQHRLQRAREERLPRPVLRPHQSEAVCQWTTHGYRGILEHATGSGKTITALACIDGALKAGKSVLVLVPSLALRRQWYDEMSAYFGAGVEMVLADGDHDQWRHGSILRDFLSPGDGQRRIVLATMGTAADLDFVQRIADLPSLLLVADEVHRIGSVRRQQILEIDADWRLGLSATWERQGDDSGSDAILAYFERVLQPPYTLADAISDGYLCEYRYFVHPLSLTAEEREAWLEITTKISRAMAAADGEMTDGVRQLLIRRGRIIKSAAEKVSLAGALLKQRYEPGEAWLVYCDDSRQLAELKDVCSALGMACFEYHTNMEGDGPAALAEFERNGGIMLSINCLDEGVDIPRISHALILASSTTRREFIQRRGRVLRTHESKHRAEIHDLFVEPGGFDDPATARFVRSEMARAQEFVSSAVDSEATKAMLERVGREAGVSFDKGSALGLEGNGE
jgi:superfamily II DNA or RNA helicase